MSDILRAASLDRVRGGAVGVMIDQALVKVFDDCQNRPNLNKPRTVTLKIQVTPKPLEQDQVELQSVDVKFKVDDSIPAQGVSRPMQALKRNRGFGFETDTDSIAHAHGQPVLQEND